MARSTISIRPQPRCWWQHRWAGLLRHLFQRYVLFPLVRLWCRPLRVEGFQHLAGLRGPVILVANHSSHFDTLLVLSALPSALRCRVTVAAAADYFYSNPLKGAAVSLFLNTFPFYRNGNSDTQGSLGRCADFLRSGWSLLIYPEGTRSLDGNIGRLKRGVGLLASSLGVPVLPLHLEGAHALMPKGSCRPRRAAVTVRIGEAVAYPQQMSFGAVVNDLRSRVLALAETRQAVGRPDLCEGTGI